MGGKLSSSTPSDSVHTIVQTKVMTLFNGGKLGPNELYELNEMVRIAIKSEIGSFISDYYKKSLLKRGMEVLYDAIEDDGDKQLLESLSNVWDRFYCNTLPTLRAIFYPIQTKGLSMSQITLLGFRDHVLLKTKIKDALQKTSREDIPQSIHQMLLVLQNVRDTPGITEDYLQLESLVARVVCPYLGTRGLYLGGDTPAVFANVQPTTSTEIPKPHTSLNKMTNMKDRQKRFSLQMIPSSQSAHDVRVSMRDYAPLSPTREPGNALNARRPRTPSRLAMNMTALEPLDEMSTAPEFQTRRRSRSSIDFNIGSICSDSDDSEDASRSDHTL